MSRVAPFHPEPFVPARRRPLTGKQRAALADSQGNRCRPSLSLAERFQKYVEPDTNGGCWLWTSGLNSTGYGELRVSGRTEKAHRVAYRLFKGPIPDKACVLHRCDTPACCNPDHLFLGTHKDNTLDMLRKGRHRTLSGDDCPWAKLTRADVVLARELYLTRTETYDSLAARFRVSPGAIQRAMNGLSWGFERLPAVRGKRFRRAR